MRYLLDTNIFIYLATDVDSLDGDVLALIEEPDAVLCMSVESVRELIVAYRNKRFMSKYWKNIIDMIKAIEKEYFIKILPLKREHMVTYAQMELNDVQDHNDPSDHIIIAHALTEHLPLISSDRKFEFYRKQGLDFIYNSK